MRALDKCKDTVSNDKRQLAIESNREPYSFDLNDHSGVLISMILTHIISNLLK